MPSELRLANMRQKRHKRQKGGGVTSRVITVVKDRLHLPWGAALEKGSMNEEAVSILRSPDFSLCIDTASRGFASTEFGFARHDSVWRNHRIRGSMNRALRKLSSGGRDDQSGGSG
jgi:hypothetical protein